MEYKKPPRISKSQIRRAGDILISDINDDTKLEKARTILNEWRACHSYPINTFQATLRKKAANKYLGEGAIVAQRLKRGSTIIKKLRELNVGLINMQDIAGVRAILPSIADVYRLKNEYQTAGRFQHELFRTDDYIQQPKANGYRSIHLIYKYKNIDRPDWDGLLVELQIRTKLQHSWATAVEAIDLFLGKRIKMRRAAIRNEWIEFFALVSSAFAYIEETQIVADHQQFSRKEILAKIREYERTLKVRHILRALKLAYDNEEYRKSYYHLLIVNTKKKKIQIKSYHRYEIDEAYEAYSRVEREFKNKLEIEPILVSTTDLENAYGSFFAKTGDFYNNLENVLSGNWAGEDTIRPHFLRRIISSIFDR